MKHLISLALKYVSRQKQRTLLTFLCVTLSVFILCSLGAYAGSLRQTMLNNEIRTDGAWEVNVRQWVEGSSQPEKALETIKGHAVVDDYLVSVSEYIVAPTVQNPSYGCMGYFLFDDGKNTKMVKSLGNSSYEGAYGMCGERRRFPDRSGDDGWIVPAWLGDMGYAVGDTVDFSLKYVMTDYDEESEVIKEIRQEVKEKKGLPIVGDDPEYAELSSEDKRRAEKFNMSSLLSDRGVDFEDFPFVTIGETQECRFSLKIAGFASEGEGFSVMCGKSAVKLFEDLVYDAGFGMSDSDVFITVNKNIDFDEALEMLAEDVGTDYYMDEPEKHEQLLKYEMRSADAITNAMDLIVLLAFMLLLFWLLARFVIDNAFEISAKERSTQYAALRIMGASKMQIAAVVLTEAIFYTVTAVPIGTAAAYLMCKSSFRSFYLAGFKDCQFRIDPVITLIAVALCVVGIFISAYTSSMWATRKLDPAEALNFGKPKRRNKKIKAHKSKLALSSKKFLSRYTKKNIGRNRSRFMIATTTMAIGVALFMTAVITLGGLGVVAVIESGMAGTPDYVLEYDNTDCLDEIRETFGDGELFKNLKVTASASFQIKEYDNLKKAIDSHLPYDFYTAVSGRADSSKEFLHITAVDEETFGKYYAKPTGMSYKEFVESGGMLMYSSIYGHGEIRKFDENHKTIQQFEESCTMLSEPDVLSVPKGLNGTDPVEIKIIGDICSDTNNRDQGLIVPVDSAFCRDNGFFTSVRFDVNGKKNYEAASAVIKDFTAKFYPSWSVDSYYANTGISELINAVFKLVGIMIIAIWLVGILSMVNSTITSVLNRSRELMMLRSVGMTRKQLRRTVLKECRMFTTTATAMGTAAAVLIVLLYAKMFGIFISMSPVIVAVFFAAVALVAVLSAFVNLGVAALAAIPGIRSLERAEALTKAV